MHRVHVAVGSNIDPATNVPEGLHRLHRAAPILAASLFYQTPAIDRPEQADYWNGVIEVETPQDQAAFRDTLRRIEAAQGRIRTSDKWAARTLDLDILLWDGTPTSDDLDTRPFLVTCLDELGSLPPGHRPPSNPDWPRVESPWP